jgi:hypothetical protein
LLCAGCRVELCADDGGANANAVPSPLTVGSFDKMDAACGEDFIEDCDCVAATDYLSSYRFAENI